MSDEPGHLKRIVLTLSEEILAVKVTYKQRIYETDKFKKRELTEMMRGAIMAILYTTTQLVVFQANTIFLDIFSSTISEDPNQSFQRPMNAFLHIGLMLETLLRHPYKQELRTVKLYNGPYSVKVGSRLKGSELILQAVGFESSKHHPQVYQLPPRINLGRLSEIAFQCFVAAMECLMISQIYRKVSKLSYDLIDVLKCRSEYAGDTDNSVLYIQKTYSPRREDPNLASNQLDKNDPVKFNPEYVSKFENRPKVITNFPHVDSGINSTKSPTSLVVRHKSDNMSVRELYGLKTPEVQNPRMDTVEDDGFAERDLSNSSEKDATEEGDLDDHLQRAYTSLLHVNPHPKTAKSMHGSSKEWDFVTTGLTKRYGTDYFLGERGDVAGVNSEPKVSPPKPCQRRAHHSAPIYANAPQIDKNNKTILETDSAEGKVGPDDCITKPWQCDSCTYANQPTSDVCEICAKSRVDRAEKQPLTTGSLQCKYCTLVNNANQELCGACDSPLDRYNTYI